MNFRVLLPLLWRRFRLCLPWVAITLFTIPALAQTPSIVYRGSGSLTVGTDSFSLDSSGNVLKNGTALTINASNGVWSLELDGSTLYAQDVWSAKWFKWANNGTSDVFEGPSVAPTVPVWSAGSGSHTLALKVQQDFYQGAAKFTAKVDGTQVGGTFTISDAPHLGASQTFNLLGSWSAGSHTVEVAFQNDRYDGTTAMDRNLYVTDILVDGVSSGNAAKQGSSTPHDYTISIGGTCTTSANATEVTATGSSICDANHNVWTLTTGTGLQVTKNGTQQGTANVILMYYDATNDRIYQENNSMAWWYTAANGTVSWVSSSDPRASANCAGTDWCDDFTTLSANQHMNGSYTWGYADTYSPAWDGLNKNGAWQSNPLYTGTNGSAFTNLYKLDGSGDLVLGLDNTPGTCTTACGNLPFISSQLISTATISQGHYVEVRAKMTATPGTNFALWLYDDYSKSGGIYQELDLVEAVRANDNSSFVASQAIHHDGVLPSNEGFYTYNIDPTVFHTYGVDWESGSICMYIDRVQTGCSAYGGNNYTGAMNMWLSSQSAAANWGGNLQSGVTMPGSMTIDYVRTYTSLPFTP